MSDRADIRKLHNQTEQASLTLCGEDIEGREGQSLLSIILSQGLPVGRSCRGRGLCGACRVHAGGQLSDPTQKEQEVLQQQEARAGDRLACKARLLGTAWAESPAWRGLQVKHKQGVKP